MKDHGCGLPYNNKIISGCSRGTAPPCPYVESFELPNDVDPDLLYATLHPMAIPSPEGKITLTMRVSCASLWLKFRSTTARSD